ncbi:MAG: hypothetical protein ACK4SI_09645 [Brevundimonas aurantiaca]|uniref:hypothetical protein n=1 Tax=Brevundimonas aurantiaca TaxID=74316 RepID=UPI00391C918D
MTGDPKRRVVLGVNHSDARPIRVFAFDQFTFPACDACNNAYSHLESVVAPIVVKLRQKEAVSELEVDTLLDWLDKVRIGLWLGTRYLNNNLAEVDPLFHITSRMGQSDRALFITHTDAADGLTVCGVYSLMFALMPSVFGLRINDMLLVSASTDLMISKSLGFPYASHRWATEGVEVGLTVQPGTERVSPIDFGAQYRFPALKIFQPMYRKHLAVGMQQHRSEYIRGHSLNPLYGRGRVLVQSDRPGRWGGISADDHLCAELVVPKDLSVEFGASALELQNELIWTIASERHLPPEKRGRARKFHVAYAMNQRYAAVQREGRIVRSFDQVDRINAEAEARFAKR